MINALPTLKNSVFDGSLRGEKSRHLQKRKRKFQDGRAQGNATFIRFVELSRVCELSTRIFRVISVRGSKRIVFCLTDRFWVVMGGSKHKKDRRQSRSRSPLDLDRDRNPKNGRRHRRDRSDTPDHRYVAGHTDHKHHRRDRSTSLDRRRGRQHRDYSNSPDRRDHRDCKDNDRKYSKHRKASYSRSRSRSMSEPLNIADQIANHYSKYPKSSNRHHQGAEKKKTDSDSDHKHQSSKKKKKKRRKPSPSSSSNSSSEEEITKVKKMSAEEIMKLKAKKKKEYEIMKALETPEQKRARRLAKKEAKERRRKEKMGWDEEYMGYTNVDNPFGDERLLDTFVWGKKMEKEGLKHYSEKEIEEHQRMKMEENKRELEKVKRRRLEREREMAEREKEREFLQREKESEHFKEWAKDEDTFHLKQAQLRSKIRIEDGRAKPIDLLAKYISAEDDDYAIEMQEPYSFLSGLTVEDLEDLVEDIKVYKELEQGKNAQYWEDITIIVEDELQRLQKMEAAARDELIRDRRQGINNSVVNDVTSVFKGKTHSQLELLEKQVRKKLQGGEGVDIGYWESLLQQLLAHMALTRLKERHQENLRRKLFKLKEEQGIENQTMLFPIVRDGSAGQSQSPSVDSPQVKKQSPDPIEEGQDSPQPGTSQESKEEEEEESEAEETEEDGTEASRYNEYIQASYSPKLLHAKDLDIDVIIYDPEDDIKKLEYMRKQVRATGQVKADTETEFIKKAKEGMNDDEAQFSVEFNLEQQSFLWSDKYRPRKPRFFNRVHTGFEWNKYNQTHYDVDNPPPKIVQGYKFNIFYPDLIDKTQTPQYTLTPLEGEPDFAMLKFIAGPPYEPIAFKVVNREWEYSWKRGFRCQFHNNIFQLWYHFKRYRYRR